MYLVVTNWDSGTGTEQQASVVDLTYAEKELFKKIFEKIREIGTDPVEHTHTIPLLEESVYGEEYINGYKELQNIVKNTGLYDEDLIKCIININKELENRKFIPIIGIEDEECYGGLVSYLFMPIQKDGKEEKSNNFDWNNDTFYFDPDFD